MNETVSSAALPAIERLRRMLARDEAREASLAGIDDPEVFRTEILALAEAGGIAVGIDEIDRALHTRPGRGSDPIERHPLFRHWPSRHWLPVRVVTAADGECFVDWAHFGGRTLDDPFYETSVQRAICRPFNRIWPYRMRLTDFVDAAPRESSMQPKGLIFHMSRCGSTLVAQMLASAQNLTVLSEPPPVDAIVQLKRHLPSLSDDDHARCLAAMAAALGRQRGEVSQHAIFKLDCWHISALPLFRRAFPELPWIFLYRDPIEVMVSHARQRGLQMVPGLLDPMFLDIEQPHDLTADAYCAEVLERICTFALSQIDLGGGLLVNYDTLPEAVSTDILPHFGLDLSDADRMAMQLASTRSAKAPTETFSADKLAKQRAANDAVQAAVRRKLTDRYTALEDHRRARSL